MKNIKVVKPLKVNIESVKFLGSEPTYYDSVITDENRKHSLMHALNWYNYNFSGKDSHIFVIDYLKFTERAPLSNQFKKKASVLFSSTVGFLARMYMVGWDLSSNEHDMIEMAIAEVVNSEPPEIVEDVIKKPNIQDIMLEKAATAGGEIEAMIDEYIIAGCPTTHTFSPIDVLKVANILTGHVSAEIAHFLEKQEEFKEAYSNKDADLREAYGHLKKSNLKNLIKFCDLIISDYNSYLVFKKANKSPRKRIFKTPKQIVFKLKYARKSDILGLKSVSPEKIINAKEMFVYNTKTRKLIHIVADAHAGGVLGVKNSTITGYDPVKSIQKTIRNPEEQLTEFMAARRPASRKYFNDLKVVDIKFSGRFNSDIIILKVF